jgi:hypothetical protein
MAGPLRNLRGRARRAANRQSPPPPPPPAAGNGAQPTPAPAAQASPAPPGVPPAGSAWPGASPAVAPRPPAPRQETRPSPPSASAPAAPAGTGPPKRTATDDSRPATQGQLKSLRRWLIVAAAWATAATVIAVLAFLAANTDEEQRLSENNAQLRQIQGNINKRLATVRQQVGDLPAASSVADMNARIKRLDRVTLRTERNLANVAEQTGDLSKQVTQFEQQLKFIQAAQKSGAGGTGTTTP